VPAMPMMALNHISRLCESVTMPPSGSTCQGARIRAHPPPARARLLRRMVCTDHIYFASPAGRRLVRTEHTYRRACDDISCCWLQALQLRRGNPPRAARRRMEGPLD
jgi:hypothetical protein